jgi:hypothetical protein
MTVALDTRAPFAEIDRRVIAEEIAANPRFAPELRRMLMAPNALNLVSVSARKAVAEEMQPGPFPESRGQWVTLRRRLNTLLREVPPLVEREVTRMPLAQKLEIVRAIAAGYEPQVAVGVPGLSDLGQFEIIGSIVGAVAGAASSIYGAKVTADAQKDIAKLQAQAAMKDLETQMAIAKASQAIASAQAAQAQSQAQAAQAAYPAGVPGLPGAAATAPHVLAQDIGGGIPLWTVPVALGGVGLVLYFILRKKKKGK